MHATSINSPKILSQKNSASMKQSQIRLHPLRHTLPPCILRITLLQGCHQLPAVSRPIQQRQKITHPRILKPQRRVQQRSHMLARRRLHAG